MIYILSLWCYWTDTLDFIGARFHRLQGKSGSPVWSEYHLMRLSPDESHIGPVIYIIRSNATNWDIQGQEFCPQILQKVFMLPLDFIPVELNIIYMEN